MSEIGLVTTVTAPSFRVVQVKSGQTSGGFAC
jgi:hypothetical protein